MLIDLPDPIDTDRVKFTKEGTATGWIMRGTLIDDGSQARWTSEQRAEVIGTPLYQRMQLGVYSGAASSFASAFTNLRVVHSHTWRKPLWDELTAASESGDAERHEAALLAYSKDFEVPEYGRADDLEQILESGKRFIEGPHLYILEVHAYDNTNEKSYKAGPYIGTKEVEATKENGWVGSSPAEVISFEWVRLEPKPAEPLTTTSSQPEESKEDGACEA